MLKNPASNTLWPCDPDKKPKRSAPEVFLSYYLMVEQCQVKNKKPVPQPWATTNGECCVTALLAHDGFKLEQVMMWWCGLACCAFICCSRPVWCTHWWHFALVKSTLKLITFVAILPGDSGSHIWVFTRKVQVKISNPFKMIHCLFRNHNSAKPPVYLCAEGESLYWWIGLIGNSFPRALGRAVLVHRVFFLTSTSLILDVESKC